MSENKTVTGSIVGGAIGTIIVWYGPQAGWFVIDSPEIGGAIAAAIGSIVAYLARYLPKPKGE